MNPMPPSRLNAPPTRFVLACPLDGLLARAAGGGVGEALLSGEEKLLGEDIDSSLKRFVYR
jgi:hypothetical protein